MNYELDFLRSLVLTIVIETAVLLFLTRTVYKLHKIKLWVIIIAGTTASFATLPYMWFILPMFIKSGAAYKIVSEFSAVVLESFILLGFLRTKYLQALMMSLICNLTSFLVGVLVGVLF